jgi:chromosome segregation ATPase
MEETSTYSAFDIKELKEELESQKKEIEFHQNTIDDIKVELGKRRSEIREEYQKRLNNLVSDIVEDGFEIKFVQTEYDVFPNNIKYNLFVDYNDDKSIMI